MKTHIYLIAWITVIFGSLPRASADLILSFTPDGTPITFSVTVGNTVNVPVYIIQRNQAPLTTILSSEGLLSAGVRLNYNTVAGSATVITNGAVLNPAFNTPTSGYPIVNNAAGFSAVSGATSNIAGVGTSGSPPAILVGTFTFQGNQIGNVTTISTAKPQALAFPEFVSNSSFTVLETQLYGNLFFSGGNTNNLIAYSTTITTVAVPEPTTYFLMGLAGLITIAVVRHRWQTRQQAINWEVEPETLEG